MGIKVFKLPDLGEGLTESEIVSWHVAEGDAVQLNQILGEVETAKAVVELPSPFTGVVRTLHEGPGTTVSVGEPIVSIEVEEPGQEDGGKASGEPASQRQPNLVGYGAAAERNGRPARRPRRTAAAAGATAVPTAVAETVPQRARAAEHNGIAGTPVPGQTQDVPQLMPAAPVAERPRSTPPVRKLAKDLGVDLAQVVGTGDRGLITRGDVQNFHDAGSAAPVEAPAPGTGGGWLAGAAEAETRIPVKGVRKLTAAAMVASAFTAPHASSFLTIDATASMELIRRLKEHKAFAGLKLTPLTITAKAVCLALGRHPELNARWDESAGEIVQQNYVNLGIAAATPRGLTVPNIKGAHRLDLRRLAEALGELAETARAGKTAPSDLRGGTISITNIGVFGIDAGTPILNPGESAILAVGAVRRQPWEYRGDVALREVVTLSLSFDHRVVDGAQAGRFLADVGTILSEPAMVLAMV
ncbi:dihydrolipoamide acetyltransferase family protein [Arthrobacter sulfonylureivorans]|uniref:Dihydrolipoamide acetyltransferase component of pyruvate dehydrogenase complex n=1 Tax=Arthrobacter sulfonylureivorans TaxID=2486855 RepID=A0ABY3W6L7_9MICC|nr:dihydrolipoamide acetyltransferase family protein [Arthrobacter sulfonylureivorans]UNK44840.1 2-oxo acid dehydrogenase subunit E2 [Arthrobacter sulfonylureivorans]